MAKKNLNKLRHYRSGVKFENPAVTGIVPEDVTRDEFEAQVKENVNS